MWDFLVGKAVIGQVFLQVYLFTLAILNARCSCLYTTGIVWFRYVLLIKPLTLLLFCEVGNQFSCGCVHMTSD